MNVEIVGRHLEVTPKLREFTLDKLRRLERLLDGPLEVHVVLSVEKHRHMVEMQVRSRASVLSGAEETPDLHVAIAEVVDKLERQAQRHKERTTDRRRRDGTRAPEAAAALSGDGAAPHPASQGRPGRLIPSQRYRLKPLSPEDAALELDASGDDLLVFRDAETYRVNVVYRRRDGNIGLVDPEF